ncbi:MAG: hypothetical protein AAGD07_18400 [Planctomycetota bacterium]
MSPSPHGNSLTDDRVTRRSIGRFVLFVLPLCLVAQSSFGQTTPSAAGWDRGVARAPIGWTIPPEPAVSDPAREGRVVRLRPATPQQDQPDRRLLWLSTPRLARGDVGAVLPAIKEAASQFSLAMVATVDRADTSGFQLRGVELGIAVEHEGRWVVTDDQWPAKAGRKLGMIEGRTLRRNLENLSPPRVLARSNTFVLFDTQGVARWNSENQWTTFRHLVWMSSTSGRLAFAIWLLRDGPTSDSPSVVEDYGLQLVHEGTREDRVIFVAGDQVTFMMPSETAFAITALPPGKTLGWTQELRAACGLREYQPDDTERLRQALNDALAKP